MGEFLLLVVNNKKKDKQFKKWQAKLSDQNNLQILIPPGFEMRITLSQRKQYFTISNRHCTIVSLNLQLIGETKILNLNGPKNKPILSKRDT